MYPTAGAELVEDLTHYLQFAMAVYHQSVAQVESTLTECGCTFEVIGSPQLSNSLKVPAHFVALTQSGPRKVCVLAIRGAADIKTAIAHALGEVKEVPPPRAPALSL